MLLNAKKIEHKKQGLKATQSISKKLGIKLDGTFVSDIMKEDLKLRVLKLNKKGVFPKIVTIYNVLDASSEKYVDMKSRECEKIGIISQKIMVDNSTTTEDIVKIVQRCNEDNNVMGILIQHPLPKQIDEDLIFSMVSPEKDVDGVNPVSFGNSAFNTNAKSFKSATPYGIELLLDYYNLLEPGKDAIIIGKSRILGKPLAEYLQNRGIETRVCGRNSQNLAEKIKQADYIFGCAGCPELIKLANVKDGAIIVDAGCNIIKDENGKTRVVGDFERLLDRDKQRLKAYTLPTGGIGPMTIATLLLQLVEASEKFAEKMQEEEMNKSQHCLDEYIK